MRLTRQLLSSLLLVAGLAAASASQAAAQIVVDHDWEDGSVEGWFPRGGHAIENSMEAAHDSTRSLKTTGRTATWNGPGLDLRTTLTAGATYRITGWVRLVTGEIATDLQFTVQRQPSGGSSDFLPIDAAAVTDAAWVQLQGMYTVPSGANDVLQVYLEAPVSASAAYYLDDFTIEQTAGPPPPGSGCPEPLDQTGFSSDFEDMTTQGWGPRGDAVLENAEVAHSGARSLEVTGRTASWQGPTHDALCKMHNGSDYNVSVWVRLVAGEPDTLIRVSIQHSLDGGADQFNTVIGNTLVTDGEWTELRVENYPFAFNVDALQIYVESDSGTASFYIDDFLLEHASAPPIQTDIPRLRDVLADFFPVGTAIEPFQTGGRHAELLLHHYNFVTAENAMKVGPLQPTEGTFNFGPADTIANFARDNGLRMHGHTLLWHAQVPDWLFQNLGSDQEATLVARLEAHIEAVMERYRDVVDSWDVVNEVIDPNGPGGLRVSPWLNIIGPEFIEIAFRKAFEMDPTARLCINDFNTHQPAKRDALWNIVQGLLADGVPVNCVGHQMHINVVNPPLEQIRATLELFASDERLVNQITEMDVSVYTNSTDTAPPTEQTLVEQGYRYRDLFNLYRELSDRIAVVTFWGLGDDTTWLRGFPIARPDAPLPFDRELQAKHAYWGIVDPSELPVIPQELGIPGGTVHVDGQVELQWDLAPAESLGAEGPLSAAFKALWDPETLYVLVEVMDATKNAGDMVEIFVGSAKYVFQGAGNQKGGATGRIVPIPGGYRLEAAIPSGETLVLGGLIRADIRVTDAAGGGRRLSWSDTSHGQDDDPSNFGVLTLTHPVQASTARRGTPVVDGVEENLWKQAPEIATNTFVLGTSGATATVKLLWDAGHLYVFAKVADPILSDASANPWEQDSVEIFVDQNNAKTTSYQGDDMQLRVNFENVQSFGGSATAADFETAVAIVPGGYHVEARIAMDVALQPGLVIGFDFQVNDDGQGDGVRSSVKTWNDTSGNAFQDTSQFGVLQLVVAGTPGQ